MRPAAAPHAPYAPPAAAPTAAFHAALVRDGWLIPASVPGVPGRGATFERVLAGVERYLEAAAADDGAEVLRFPPVIPRALMERSGYLESFPHLAGSVHSFAGTDADHRALLRAVESGAPGLEAGAGAGAGGKKRTRVLSLSMKRPGSILRRQGSVASMSSGSKSHNGESADLGAVRTGGADGEWS